MKLKIYAKALLLVMLFSIAVSAQPRNNDITMINNTLNNCEESLQHSNQGVVESAIFVVIQFKHKYPDRDLKEIETILEKLAENSDNPSIRYKAQLATMYFKYNNWFQNLDVTSIKDQRKVYEQITDTIENMVFASNI